MIKKMIPLCLACCVLVALAPAARGAGLWVNGDYDNFDVKNDTGKQANDFHILFRPGAFDPSWVLPGPDGLFTREDHYQNAKIVPMNDGWWEIRWTVGSTAPGQTSHFGIGMNGAHDLQGFLYWTKDGERLYLPEDPPEYGVVDGAIH